MFEYLKRLLRSGWAQRAQSRRAGFGALADNTGALSLYREAAALVAAGALAQAEAKLEAAIRMKQDFAEAYYSLGAICRKLGRLDEALDHLAKAVAYGPGLAAAHFLYGSLLLQQGRHDEALAALQKALDVNPAYPEALNAIGVALIENMRYHEARSCLERAIALKPDFAIAYSNFANVLLAEYYDDEGALRHVQRALELEPGLASAYIQLARVLVYRGEPEKGLAAAKRALELEPGNSTACFAKALAHLALGEFGAGWDEYEARRELLKTFKRRRFPFLEWDGSPLNGHTLLVYAEQGLGDEIMFASCVPDLISAGGRVVLDCAFKLERLFRRSFSQAIVHASDQDSADLEWLRQLPPIDYAIPAGSLPQYFRRDWASFPPRSHYLVADAERIQRWKTRLSQLGSGPVIGISWRGGSYYTNQQARSVSLESLLPILRRRDMVFVSLQYTECREELKQFEFEFGVALHHWAEAIEDCDETAALVGAVDLVISVQTAVVHLSGALGKPVWVLVPSSAEWRYLARGDCMSWYPSVRLFRQQQAREWGPVIDHIGDELGKLYGASPSAV